ncbi:F-box protein [Salix suchowensis]|nr:F-box protein [Salix suchowensis]
MDGFDRLPDSLILIVFNSISDIKALIRCRSVSKTRTPTRSSLSSNRSSNPSTISSIPHQTHSSKPNQNSPARILSQFHRIRDLQIELPAGDLKLEKGAAIKWRAEFGKSLKSCVILGLKTRVVWTISALIAASARHYLLNDVVKEHREMERLVLVDREGEGTVAMEKKVGGGWRRTVVPCVRMRMRHEQRVQLKNGVWIEDVTLVVVRPCAFGGGIDGEAVQVLLKNKSYLLEMNSF